MRDASGSARYKVEAFENATCGIGIMMSYGAGLPLVAYLTRQQARDLVADLQAKLDKQKEGG